MTFMHVFFYLAAYPEYLKALREEVEDVVRKYGWTKEGLDQMQHIDSFIKESQRLNSLPIVPMAHVMLKDHVFSDGAMVPKGTTIGVATPRAHLNGDRYEYLLQFDGFRYVKLKEQRAGESEKKLDTVSSNGDALAFGLGRHACHYERAKDDVGEVNPVRSISEHRGPETSSAGLLATRCILIDASRTRTSLP